MFEKRVAVGESGRPELDVVRADYTATEIAIRVAEGDQSLAGPAQLNCLVVATDVFKIHVNNRATGIERRRQLLHRATQDDELRRRGSTPLGNIRQQFRKDRRQPSSLYGSRLQRCNNLLHQIAPQK